MAYPIVILGTSNSAGRTRKAIDTIIGDKKTPIVDLNTIKISPYDYQHKNQDDDYIALMEKITNENDLIVLATPVYWYTMSAQMKIFIDRITDLLSLKKEIGRKLRGKSLFIITSYNTSLPKAFEAPFEQTAKYLGITYKGCSYIYNGENPELLENNKQAIEKAKKVMFEKQ